MTSFINQVRLTFLWALRDKILHAVLGVALLMLVLVPVLSLFSMRQVQELAITLTLSAISFSLLGISVFLGSSSIWRDIERRYTSSVLTLPLSRTTYVAGRLAGILLFIVLSALVLGIAGACVIAAMSGYYPSDVPVRWSHVAIAIGCNVVKYALVAALALLLSSISTSFFLPFFGTVILYLAGSGSQDVYEYISSSYGSTIPKAFIAVIKLIYYLIPNLAIFDFTLNAVYGLPLTWEGLFFALAYGMVYTLILLIIACSIFGRRQLP